MSNPESHQKLAGKVVMVTGASKGIGSAVAIGCARAGANVIVHYNSDRDGAETVAQTIRSLDSRAFCVQADIGKVSEIRRLFAICRREFPELHVLINNAALTGWSRVFDTTEEIWDRVVNANLKGTFFMSLEAARWMKECSVAGSIVNVSTNCAALGVRNLVTYATSKAGVHGMTRQLAVELAEHNIRVNTFAPGPTNVDRNLRDDPDYKDTWGSVVPMQRTADPEEMVGPAVFLASGDASYVTGQVFYADGGWAIQGRIPLENMEKAASKNQPGEQG